MTPETRIHLCGPLRVEVRGQAREEHLHGRQGRLLLAFLALHRARPVRRNELVAALWPEERAAQAEGALPPVLSRLRRAIAPATIEGRDAVTLDLPSPVWVDVEQAHEALVRARGAASPVTALEAAREVEALVAPGLLPGLEAEWLDAERERLDDVRVEALEIAARALCESDPASAESAARQAVVLAPFRESAWAALIGALIRQGNMAEALRAYDDVRTRLRDELGATPGPDLVALHGRLLTPAEPPAAPPAPEARHRPAPDDLVERDEELHAVEQALDRTAAGTGGALLFEGHAGIGKTRLLGELAARARARDALVLEARAGALEREYAFGIVRQLLGPATDPATLDGPLAAARAALDDTHAGGQEGTFPVLEALYRLVERLGRERPVVLCIDDLQWSDLASLRWAAYLARRIGGLPVLIAATIRIGEPDADEDLLAEIAREPVTVALSPLPLTEQATARLVREQLGEQADARFIAACQGVTAGNPLLVGQLLRGLASEGVSPDAQHAAKVREIGPRAVARTVLLRLSRLEAPAVDVARAVAVLGEDPGLPMVAALAGAEEPAAARAVQALVRAEILRADDALGFVHPLVRDAVYGEFSAPTRALEHERAARLLAEAGAPPERIAAQLLLAPPRGDTWVVTQLREAAGVALQRGAPDAAMRLLERAQAEPPPPDQRAALALELGGSAAYLQGPAGVEPLQRAYADLSDPIDRGRAAVRLSHLLLFVSSPQEGVALARRAERELPADAEDLRDALRAITLIGAAFGAVDPEEFRTLDDVRRDPRVSGPGGRALTAMTALAVALTSSPAAEASELARRAFADGLAAIELTAPVALGSAALALGDPAEGLDAMARYSDHARRQGEVLGSIGADLWGGITQIWAGDLPGAMEALERAHEGERLWGTKLDAVMAYSAAFTALAQLERGDPLPEVADTLHRVEARDARPDGARFWLATLAELALAEGRPADAIETTRRLEPTRPRDTHPIWAPWRSLRARALVQLGEIAEARTLAEDELELARRVGAPWVVGRGLRILALTQGADGVGTARDAVALLAESSARLELAKAHLALGRAQRAAGEDAAAALDTAARLMEECGARMRAPEAVA